MHSLSGYAKLTAMKKALQGIGLLFAIVAMLAGIFAFLHRNDGTVSIPRGNSGGGNSTQTQLNSATAVKIAAPTALAKEIVSPAFSGFIATEAASLSSPHLHAAAAEARVASQAAGMGEAEIEFARDLALAPEAAGNQRVLAVYILTAGGKKTWAALKDIALAPTSSNRAEPHSMEELNNTRSKAFSIMAVDALADQAAKNAEAREELARWESEAKDSTIRSYIQKKLKDLPST